MIRTSPGDLLAVEHGGHYYYAIILGPVALFGGHWTYVLHQTSSELLTPDAVLRGNPSGFHAFVDFIWAKREDRITRVAKKIDVTPYDTVTRLKTTHTARGKAEIWFLYDLEQREVGRVTHLTQEQRRFPLRERIDDALLVELVDQKWTPEQDPRI